MNISSMLLMLNLKTALKLADSSEPKKRREGVKNLGNIADRMGIDKVRYCLSDTDPDIRAEATLALGKFQEPTMGKYILPMLRDPEITVRIAAAAVIGDMKLTDGTKTLTEIARKKDEYISLRQAAVQALVKLNAEGSLFVELIEDPEPSIRVFAIQGLKQINTIKFKQNLLAKLKDKSADVRLEAANALVTITDDALLSQLIPLLKDNDSRVREKIVDILAATGKHMMKAPLMELLDDSSTFIRNKAKRALEKLCDAEMEQAQTTIEKEKDAKIKAKKTEIAQLQEQITALQQEILGKERDIQGLNINYAQKRDQTLKEIKSSYGV